MYHNIIDMLLYAANANLPFAVLTIASLAWWFRCWTLRHLHTNNAANGILCDIVLCDTIAL